MRQSIRALGWTVTISMLLLCAFIATAVYSLLQTVMMEQNIRFGEFQTSFSNDTLVLSMPIIVNNTGYYDITDLKITTTLKDRNRTTLTAKTTEIGEIKKGLTKSELHSLSLSPADLFENMTYLLFDDTEFKIDFSIGLKYAYALGFNLAMMNTSIPWGAPLHNLNLREVSLFPLNATHIRLDIHLELENHSFFDMIGILHLKAYNEAGEYIGSGRGLINVQSNSGLTEPIEVTVEIENFSDYTGKGYVEVYLELPMFDYAFKLEEISYG